MRILRSLVSIFLVTTLTYMIIYTLTPRNLIFKNDPNYNKVAKTKDSKINYENTVYDRMGYLEYMDSKSLQQKASKEDSSVTVDATTANEKIYKEYIKKYDIDIIVHGDDWDGEGYFKQIRVTPEFLEEHHVSMVYLPYTKGISTSELVEKIKASK